MESSNASSNTIEPTDPLLPRIWIKPYYRSFNGLRGMAVAMVFVAHYGNFLNLA